jgi:NMD protein affecting ribosome stability and mRNA decay
MKCKDCGRACATPLSIIARMCAACKDYRIYMRSQGWELRVERVSISRLVEPQNHWYRQDANGNWEVTIQARSDRWPERDIRQPFKIRGKMDKP